MKIVISLLVVLVGIFLFLFVGEAKEAEDISWGVNFSQKQGIYLNEDWKKVYLAVLQDLGVKDLKVAAHWDLLERQDQEFFFEDLDWQMDQAALHEVKVLLAIGMKTPRWPECHIPQWAYGLPDKELEGEVLEMLQAVVERYKSHPALLAWQVENEPLFTFGDCPWRDFSIVQKEVELVRSLDSNHDIVISDSGEMSLWWNAARLGDKVGVTLYRKVWSKELNMYAPILYPAISYARKAWLVEKLFGKEVFVGELQAEPWVPGELESSSFAEQEKTMTISRLRENIAFAKKTGMNTFYLWGAEWWYAMKEMYDRPEFWQEAKQLF